MTSSASLRDHFAFLPNSGGLLRVVYKATEEDCPVTYTTLAENAAGNHEATINVDYPHFCLNYSIIRLPIFHILVIEGTAGLFDTC